MFAMFLPGLKKQKGFYLWTGLLRNEWTECPFNDSKI